MQSLMSGDSPVVADSLNAVLFSLLLAFVAGQAIGWIYQKTHRGLSYSQSFTASLVVMPVLVAMMMLLMTTSITVAFGLLAVFAVVRFRNVLKDTRDTIFVLWAIVEGMAAGTGRASLAVIGVIVIACIMVYLSATQYGARRRYDTILNLICVGGSAAASQLVESVLGRHCLTTQLASIQELGQDNFDLSYRLTLRDPSRRNELEAELRSLDPVQRVSMFAHDDESEV
jgi:uncharacterized membrane protein YhiD involved in acid resistance